jgi:hypothetical protein
LQNNNCNKRSSTQHPHTTWTHFHLSYHWTYLNAPYCVTMSSSTLWCQIYYLILKTKTYIFWNILYPPLTIFFFQKKFKNFSISKNNIINVEVAKVLQYLRSTLKEESLRAYIGSSKNLQRTSQKMTNFKFTKAHWLLQPFKSIVVNVPGHLSDWMVCSTPLTVE